LVEFTTWLLLSSIEVFGMLFLLAQLSKKIKTTQFRRRLGWGFFAGGIGVKIILYGIGIASDMEIASDMSTYNIFK